MRRSVRMSDYENLMRATDKNVPKQTMPQRIRAKREELELTQEQAAHAVGVTWITWQRWEAGKITPPRERVAKIAKALNVTAIWLEFGVRH